MWRLESYGKVRGHGTLLGDKNDYGLNSFALARLDQLWIGKQEVMFGGWNLFDQLKI